MKINSQRSIVTAVLISMFLMATPVLAEKDTSVLKDFQGKPRKISDYVEKGKWTLVVLWRHDCHICAKESPGYSQMYLRRKDKDVNVLGISMDGKQNKFDAEAFIEGNNVKYPNLIGEGEEVATLFYDMTGEHFQGTPTLMFYAPDGSFGGHLVGGVPANVLEKEIFDMPLAKTP